jgi:hypothetical protein
MSAGGGISPAVLETLEFPAALERWRSTPPAR